MITKGREKEKREREEKRENIRWYRVFDFIEFSKVFSAVHALNRVYRSVEANGPIKRINIYRIRACRERVPRFTEGSPIIHCNTRVFHHRCSTPLFSCVWGTGNYVFQPSLSNSLLCFFTALDTEPPFFHNIVTAFQGTASTLLPELFSLPSFPLPFLFSPLCSFSSRAISVYPPRFSPSFSPPLLTTCYNIAGPHPV